MTPCSFALTGFAVRARAPRRFAGKLLPCSPVGYGTARFFLDFLCARRTSLLRRPIPRPDSRAVCRYRSHRLWGWRALARNAAHAAATNPVTVETSIGGSALGGLHERDGHRRQSVAPVGIPGRPPIQARGCMDRHRCGCCSHISGLGRDYSACVLRFEAGGERLLNLSAAGTVNRSSSHAAHAGTPRRRPAWASMIDRQTPTARCPCRRASS